MKIQTTPFLFGVLLASNAADARLKAAGDSGDTDGFDLGGFQAVKVAAP